MNGEDQAILCRMLYIRFVIIRRHLLEKAWNNSTISCEAVRYYQ